MAKGKTILDRLIAMEAYAENIKIAAETIRLELEDKEKKKPVVVPEKFQISNKRRERINKKISNKN